MATERCVRVGSRDYTVWFGDDGQPTTVNTHVVGKAGYVQAFRRIPLSGPTARAAIAKAQAEQQ